MFLSFRDLEVWKNSMDLVDSIYSITKQFPKEELFILTSQMRRAAISIPSNIAEGFNRKNTKEYIQFCYTSLASLSELDTQIEIAYRQKYIENLSEFQDKILIIRKQLLSLIKSLKLKIQ